ncbi:MAG: tRNA dihydrouridine synthase DusB [Verrucomicrobia bacterium]|nr:tRNA dihydrouridine synthase DusB [Verrucomicrobiota bacterium]
MSIWEQPGPLLYLAPMAGITDSVFRRLCKEHGADVMVTEFVSAEGLLHRNQRTREMVAFTAAERPLGVQLFGAEPDRLAEAARAVIDWAAPDFIDLNFGCPVNKVVCKHGGSALLRDCPLLEKVARTVVRAVDPVPVTAKIRLGWDATTINAAVTARLLEDAGIQAVAVHGRTKAQGYSGEADWNEIARVAQTVSIPVIGNGDLRTAEGVKHRLGTTGVRGAMIGRGAMSDPWLFGQAKALIAGLPPPPPPTLEERWAHIVRHCEMAVAESDSERHRMASLRAQLMAYSHGMPDGRQLRPRFQQVARVDDVRRLAAEVLSLES